MLALKKEAIAYDGTFTLSEYNSDPLYIILPPRQEYNFQVYSSLNSENIEVLPPICYRAPYKPYSNADDSRCLIERIRTYQTTNSNSAIYIIAQSLGSLTAIRALSQQNFENITVVLVTPPSSISTLLYHQPIFEIVLLMLHLLTAALILIACGHAGLSNLSITGYILSSAAACIALICCIYQYSYNHNSYTKWVYHKQRIPNFRQYIDLAANFALSNYWDNTNPFRSIVLLTPKVTTLTLLLVLGIIYFACYIPAKIIHYLSHALVYSYLWLMDLHQDYQALADTIQCNIYTYHAASDTLLNKHKLQYGSNTREIPECDHGSISIHHIMENLRNV